MLRGNNAATRSSVPPNSGSPECHPDFRMNSRGSKRHRLHLGERAPISLLDEDNQGFRPDAFIFHRLSACFTMHDRLERVHVGDVHRQSDAIGRI